MLSGSGGLGGGSASWSKPAALVCHICGREYGTASLKIHVPQCEKMWIEREKLKDRKDRRPVPKAVSAIPTKLNLKDPIAMAEYNERATQQFNERALVPCPNCARTFFEDRLVVHLRSCRPGAEAARVGTGRIKSASEAVAAATPMKARGPGQTYASPASAVTSPSAASAASVGAVMKKLSPTAAAAFSKPRGAGVTFADNGSSTQRAKVTPVKASTGSWEDDLNDELEAAEAAAAAAPPSKVYSIPTNVSTDADEGELAECSTCGRRFNVDRLAKHETVCAKQQVSEAKRQKLIARKQAKTAHLHPEPGSQKSANTDAWKGKHEEFQAAIQYAKKMAAMQKAGVSLASLPPPPRSENPDYVQCPHCERRFNQQAAERHIPKCATTINRPKPVARNGPVKPPAAGSMAAQRARQQQPMSPPAMRPLSTAGFGGGSPTGAYGSPHGYGDEYGARPSTSGGRALGRAPGTASAAAPRASSRPRPTAQRSPSAAHEQQDLHQQISQLTATVAQLSKVVLSPQGRGAACRACGESNPPTARFCCGCGRQCK